MKTLQRHFDYRSFTEASLTAATLRPDRNFTAAKMHPDAALLTESRGVLAQKRHGNGVKSFQWYCICRIFPDLSKAFDTVNYQILVQKLYRYGIHAVPLQWFKSYVESRTQYVEVESIKSNPPSIQCGLPQVSTLGSLLFLI